MGYRYAKPLMCAGRWLAAYLLIAGLSTSGRAANVADDWSAEDVAFFESRVRPVLVERCHACHGDAESAAGELNLASRDATLHGGVSGPAAVVRDADASLLVQAVRYRDALQMPPDGKLPEAEIAALAEWVQRGLPWPQTLTPAGDAAAADGAQSTDAGKGGAGEFQITDEQRRFWSFQPLAAQAPPVQEHSWCTSPVDRFILAKLEAAGLAPSPPADRRTLIRRATFDLLGLPPTPEEVAAFVHDAAPDAFAKVVDRLLASPRYGERWGRHWLDLVRYTDSFDARIADGTNVMDCNAAWRYRDWVVEAMNADMPYDQFVMNQLAGDLLPPADGAERNLPGIIATGVLAIGNWGGGDADKEKLLTDIADDQIDLIGRTFMGLTLACARCHDHKFDPISTADYYALAGIFMSTHILEDPGPKTNGPPMLRVSLETGEQVAKRTEFNARMAALKEELDALNATQASVAERTAKQAEIDALAKSDPGPAPYAHACLEGGCPQSPQEGTHDVRIHIRGRYDRLGPVVPRRFPEVISGAAQEPVTQGSGRLQLARWLTRPDHPLTARVMVNRIWQHHFGEGIVRTPSNFGTLGEAPTHPELLDWLAGQFIEHGWSIKAMHRLIMLSSAYQQASSPTAEALERDGDNRLLSRMNRRRLDAEQLRDSLLAVGGNVEFTAGGPAVREIQSPRRTIYLMTIRSDRSSFRDLFDGADSTAIVDRRIISTVAPQALFMLNHPFVQAQAQRLTELVLAGEADRAARLSGLYQRLFGREPTEAERQLGETLLAAWQQSAGEQHAAARESHAWKQYCQALLCSNEFVFVD